MLRSSHSHVVLSLFDNVRRGVNYRRSIFSLIGIAVFSTSAVAQIRTVSGTVVDPAGRPVVNALIGLRSRGPGMTPLRREFVAADPNRGTSRAYAGVFTRTDARGRYTLSAPDTSWNGGGKHVYEIMTMVEGYRSVFDSVPSGMATYDIRLEKAPWDTLRWRVRGVNGAPLRGAVVQTMAGDEVWRSVRTDAQGRVTVLVPTGEWMRARIQAPGYSRGEVNIGQKTKLALAADFRLRKPVHGTVTDERGTPVAGCSVAVGDNITVTPEFTLANTSVVPITTDREGRFIASPVTMFDRTGEVYSSVSLFARSVDGARGALTTLDSTTLMAAAPAVHLRLAPLRQVTIPFQFPVGNVGKRSPSVSLYHFVRSPTASADTSKTIRQPVAWSLRPQVQGGDSALRTLSLRVPPGEYGINVFSFELRTAQVFVPVTVLSGSGALAVTPIMLELTPIAAMQGKPATELQAVTLDGAPASLAAYRGKVVILDFWAWWCGPCVAKMPKLIALQQRYPSQLVVVALHDATARNRREYEAYFNRSVAARVGNAPLPFPVLLDRPTPEQANVPLDDREHGQGLTIDRYGIQAFPTTIVIDAQGNVVGTPTTDEALEQMLTSLIPAS